jgi:hypothetical protein
MAMVGHKTEAIHRPYAIVAAGALRDAAMKIDRAAGTNGLFSRHRPQKRPQRATSVGDSRAFLEKSRNFGTGVLALPHPFGQAGKRINMSRKASPTGFEPVFWP